MAKRRKRRRKRRNNQKAFREFFHVFIVTFVIGMILMFLWTLSQKMAENMDENWKPDPSLASNDVMASESIDENYIKLGKFLDTSLMAVGDRRYYYLFETPNFYAYFQDGDTETLYKVHKEEAEVVQKDSGDPVVEIKNEGGVKYCFYLDKFQIQTVYGDDASLDEIVKNLKRYTHFN